MNYGLYVARVVSATLKDNRLQVKVIPQLADIADEDCPVWPYFFRDESLQAIPGDIVWVICSNDFTIGYVLGMANYSTYDSESYKDYSIPQDLVDDISDTFGELKADTKLELANLKVTYWNDDSIHFVERSTGGNIIAFRNGTLYIMRPNELLFMLGDSIFQLNSSGISMKGNSIKLQANDIGLGNNPVGSVLVTAGKGPLFAQSSAAVRA